MARCARLLLRRYTVLAVLLCLLPFSAGCLTLAGGFVGLRITKSSETRRDARTRLLVTPKGTRVTVTSRGTARVGPYEGVFTASGEELVVAYARWVRRLPDSLELPSPGQRVQFGRGGGFVERT